MSQASVEELHAKKNYIRPSSLVKSCLFKWSQLLRDRGESDLGELLFVCA